MYTACFRSRASPLCSQFHRYDRNGRRNPVYGADFAFDLFGDPDGDSFKKDVYGMRGIQINGGSG